MKEVIGTILIATGFFLPIVLVLGLKKLRKRLDYLKAFSFYPKEGNRRQVIITEGIKYNIPCP